MTVDLLINAIVRQTTILIAQLATSGGLRAPLATVASQVFLDLVSELERQRVSRKVSADMFGLGLRTYRRKIQRLSASVTDRTLTGTAPIGVDAKCKDSSAIKFPGGNLFGEVGTWILP